MIEPNNGQALHVPQRKQPLPNGHQARYTAETVLHTRPKTYHKIVHLLADPYWSVLQISKACRVSEHTIRAIRAREAETIAERKKSLVAMLANAAELGAGRMEETIGKASLRDAAIGTGIAVDKMLALTGQLPSTNIAIINMHTPQERELLNECHRRLRAICIGESKDEKADMAWLEAYGKLEKSKAPSRYNTITGQWVYENDVPRPEQPAR
jgi:hypothetical protein